MHWLLNKVKGDKVIWLIILLLSLFSVLAVYSSTGTLAYKYQSGNTEYYLIKHFFLLFFGFLLMYLMHLIDHRYFSRMAQLLLYISFPLLIYTLFFGTDINQARRWLTLPVINLTFQTSDLAKLALIMYTARVLSKKQPVIKDFKEAFLPVIMPVFAICILIAPADLSSAGALFLTCMLLMFIGRINLKYLGMMIGAGVLIIGFITLLTIYAPDQGRVSTWKNRIENFLEDDKGSYQVQQAKIAIAKGGFIGEGPGKSTQRNFLPHPYSDFIYAIIIEEYGILGGAVIVILYLLFLYRSILIFIKSPKAFGALLAVGLSFSLVIQAILNMAVTVNMLPVTGLTLPLISMGGTSLWFTSVSLGIILSVSREVEEETAEGEKEKESTLQKDIQMSVE